MAFFELHVNEFTFESMYTFLTNAKVNYTRSHHTTITSAYTVICTSLGAFKLKIQRSTYFLLIPTQ